MAIELLTQVVVPLLGVWLTAHLALKSVFRQQRYERKRQAYIEIIDACAVAIKSTEHKSELAKGYDEHLPPFTEDLNSNFQRAVFVIETNTKMKTLVISKMASSALEAFSNRSNVCDEKRQYGEMEYWAEEAKGYSVLLAQIIEIAKKDLS